MHGILPCKTESRTIPSTVRHPSLQVAERCARRVSVCVCRRVRERGAHLHTLFLLFCVPVSIRVPGKVKIIFFPLSASLAPIWVLHGLPTSLFSLPFFFNFCMSPFFSSCLSVPVSSSFFIPLFNSSLFLPFNSSLFLLFNFSLFLFFNSSLFLFFKSLFFLFFTLFFTSRCFQGLY